LVSGGLDLYTANKSRKMSNEIDRLQRAQTAGTAMTLSAIGTTLSAIGSLAEMNFALQIQMAECDAKLQTLTDISWKISDYFDRKEMHEEFVATMRHSIHTMNRELDLIDSLTEENPAYALWKASLLLEVIEERDVRVEHFSRVSQVEMTSAQNLLDRAADTRSKISTELRESDRIEEYRLLTKTLEQIADCSDRLNSVKNEYSREERGLPKFGTNNPYLIEQQKRRTAPLREQISSLEEEEIPALWDSIAHLIPYSSALEKA